MTRLKFQVEAEAPGTAARAGRFVTAHGEIETPVFMPVGTQATVKGLSVDVVRATGSKMLLANTYHLLLRPGIEVFKMIGGIHRFMNWQGPVLTDSGGFQIFSLSDSRKISEAGAEFQSYVDGKTHLLSPELSIEMQLAIGSDVMMVLDQCIDSTAPWAQAKEAMELTHRWARRSLQARGPDSVAAMFGIVQGACFPDLRKQSADVLTQLSFDGFAIGGLAVGETKSEREDFTELTVGFLPKDRPRYLMGVGNPIDILEAVHRGVDMFDCIIPSSLGKQGIGFTSRGRLQLKRSVYKMSDVVLDPDCDCATCAHYSRAYLHHLVKSDELLGWQLMTQHNLRFYRNLMMRIRQSLLAGTFYQLYLQERERLVLGDSEHPMVHPIRKPEKRRKKETLHEEN